MAISGNITYDYYLSAAGFPGGDFLDTVKRNFSEVKVFGEDTGEECFRHIRTVADFLHGGKAAFGCRRCMVYDYKPAFAENSPFYDFRLMLSFFADESILRVSFHTSYRDATPDFLIAERQSGRHRSYDFEDGKTRTFNEICDEITKKILPETQKYEETFLLEINEWDNYGKEHMDPVSAVRRDNAKLLYGFLSGDEGWEFVPMSTVDARLKATWSSRDFMRLYVFGAGFLLLNFNRGICHEHYLERQHQFGGDIYGGVNDYFMLPSCPLSVNHGIMHACEYVRVIKCIVDRVYYYHSSLRSSLRVADNIRKAKKYRSDILGALNKIERVQISEIGELEEVILKSQNISPVIEKVKSLLDLLESELNLAYSTHTNTMINILTVAGLIISATGIILSYIL